MIRRAAAPVLRTVRIVRTVGHAGPVSIVRIVGSVPQSRNLRRRPLYCTSQVPCSPQSDRTQLQLSSLELSTNVSLDEDLEQALDEGQVSDEDEDQVSDQVSDEVPEGH